MQNEIKDAAEKESLELLYTDLVIAVQTNCATKSELCEDVLSMKANYEKHYKDRPFIMYLFNALFEAFGYIVAHNKVMV